MYEPDPAFKYRIAHYRFFALSFLQKPDRSALRRFLETLSDSSSGHSQFREAFIDVLSKAVSFGENDWHTLCNEYSALFESTDGRFLPLWESSIYEEGVLMNATTLCIKQFYRRGGIKLSPELCQLEDHIGIECAFMHELLTGKTSIACAPPEAGAGRLKAMRDFLRDHLAPFAEAFCQAVKSQTSDRFWLSLADYFSEYIQGEHRYLASVKAPNAVLTLDSVSRDAALSSLFSVLGPDERADPPVTRVPVSGINNCGGRCLFYADVQDGAVLRLSGGRQQPEVSDEAQLPCVRGAGYRQTYLNTARLRYPMKRIGKRGEGRFARISWDEAIDEIAVRMKEIKEAYGPASRYVNYATGVAGVLRGDNLARHLLALDGGYLGLYNTYSSACSEIATPYVYGTLTTGSTADTLTDAKLIILWGHNPVETIFGSATRRDLMRAKNKGVKIIVVDPRYSDSAKLYADEWIGLRPTTDGALIDAMAYVILTEGLHDQHFMDTYCLGFDRDHMPEDLVAVENYVDYCLGRSDGTPKTPRWAEDITGVPAETIARLARKYAASKPASLLPGLGYQRHGNGEQSVRGLAMLACLTGNVGVRGGNAAGQNYVRQHIRPRADLKSNPLPVSIPAFLWTDAVKRALTEKDGVRGATCLPSPIKMIFNLAGNTLINQHSDITATANILKDTALCRFIVCSDVFMTPSAKFADILLPGTSLFETRNIISPWDQGNYLLYNSGMVPPLFEARFEYDWLAELADRLGLKQAFTKGHGTTADWLRDIYEKARRIETELPAFEEFALAGGYQFKNIRSFVAFENEIRDPENNPFPTPSGKIEIFSPRLYAMAQPDVIPAIPKYVPSFEGPADEKRARYPLQLIGWHMKTRCHSIHFHSDPLDTQGEQVLWIHPADASNRRISNGDAVVVWNDRGQMRLKAHVTDRIVPGVVAMPQGAWYRPGPDGVDMGGSLNVLTTLRPTPLAKGNPQHSNLVEVALSLA